MVARSALLAALLVAASCTTGPQPSPLVITTDRTSYSFAAGGSATVVTTAANDGQSGLYVSECNGSSPTWLLAVRVNGQWQMPVNPTCFVGVNGIASAPEYRVGPGTATTDTTLFTTAGTYRWELYSSPDSGVMTKQLSVSNTFVVSGPP